MHPTIKDTETNKSVSHRDTNELPVELQFVQQVKSFSKSDRSDQHPYELPSILLTNLQSFGKPGKTDKTTELELVLDLNDIDIAVCTETWATDATLKNLEFDEYNMFHSIRNNCSRASGGLSIFVKNTIPAGAFQMMSHTSRRQI